MELIVTEILQEGISEDKEVIWLKCRTSTNEIVAFWGEFNQPNRNIAALKGQSLPVHVEILSPEECEPTRYERSKYNLSLSVPSSVFIQINTEY